MPASWDEQRLYSSQPRKKGTLSYILMYIFVSRLFYFVDPILSIFKVWDPQTPPPLTLWFYKSDNSGKNQSWTRGPIGTLNNHF